MPASLTTTPPARSGARLRASPSRPPAAPCSGPFRRPSPSGACTLPAISCCTRTAVGPAAAGCPTRSSTAIPIPVRSSNGSRATASGPAGLAPTGTWSFRVWCIRPRASGPSRPIPPSRKRPSSARSPSFKSTRTTTGASSSPSCAPTASASRGTGALHPAAPSLSPASTSRAPVSTLRLPSMRSWTAERMCSSRRVSTSLPSPSRSTAATPSSWGWALPH